MTRVERAAAGRARVSVKCKPLSLVCKKARGANGKVSSEPWTLYSVASRVLHIICKMPPGIISWVSFTGTTTSLVWFARLYCHRHDDTDLLTSGVHRENTTKGHLLVLAARIIVPKHARGKQPELGRETGGGMGVDDERGMTFPERTNCPRT